MATGRYYGNTAGAVVTWAGERVTKLTIGAVDRQKPEGADWILRFTPQRDMSGKDRRALAMRLNELAVDYKLRGQPGSAVAYLGAIDRAIKSAVQP